MLKKSTLLLFISLLLFFGCEQKMTQPQENSLKIVSFTGEQNFENNESEFTFIQNIEWTSEDDKQYAIRFTTSDGDDLTGIETDENGWVLFQSQNEIKSIWTDQKAFSYTFNSRNGMIEKFISKVEIKQTNQISIIENFRDDRVIGTIIQNNFAHSSVGKGVTINLRESYDNIFVEGMFADHFMYRINIVDSLSLESIEEGDWHSTLLLDDIRHVELNEFTTPSLQANSLGEITEFEVYVVTRNGFEDSENTAKVQFYVKDGFSPESLIYIHHSPLLGEFHYLPYHDPGMFHNIYSEDKWAINFFKDSQGTYNAINSDDLKLYLRVGYYGEYDENEFHPDRYSGQVWDADTHNNYFATIAFYDITIDNLVPDLDIPGSYEYDGWLRIQKKYFDQEFLVFENLENGMHTIEYRVVDSQMQVDETPAILNFELVEPKSADEKDGILILDMDEGNNAFCPDEEVDNIYLDLLSTYNGTISVLDAQEIIYSVWEPLLQFGRSYFSPAELNMYKTIILHSDNPSMTASTNIRRNINVFDLYFKTEGNMIISGGANLVVTANCINTIQANFIGEYFGFFTNTTFEYLGESYTNNPFFVGANSDEFQNLELNIESPFNPLINTFQGLGPITYFSESILDSCQPIYTIECKPVDAEVYPPNQEQYDMYQGLTCAVKNDNGTNKTYLFGFPLSYMEIDNTENMLMQIITEIEE